MPQQPEFDLELRAAIYRHFADHATAPTIDDMARAAGRPAREIADGYQRLYARRMLVLMPDGESIRMAPPFSGIETQHRVEALGRTYFANCAWDSFGIPAALHAEADVHSRCEQTRTPLRLRLTADGLRRRQGAGATSQWFFHVVVPAAHWWRDIVYT